MREQLVGREMLSSVVELEMQLLLLLLQLAYLVEPQLLSLVALRGGWRLAEGVEGCPI